MQNFSEDSKAIVGINVTPLVDITLVLLIIFMATAPMMHKMALKVDIPRAAEGERKATETLQVVMLSENKVLLENNEMTFSSLAETLRARVGLDPALHVSISADQKIPYGNVVGLLDLVRTAGVKRAGLDVQPKKL